MNHVVEILFTRHCRHLSEAIERVRAATEAVDEVEVRLVQVQTMREARDLAFVGSPTVRSPRSAVPVRVQFRIRGLRSTLHERRLANRTR